MLGYSGLFEIGALYVVFIFLSLVGSRYWPALYYKLNTYHRLPKYYERDDAESPRKEYVKTENRGWIKIKRGEGLLQKFLEVWYYTGIVTFTGTIILLLYGFLFGFLQVPPTRSGINIVFGITIMVSFLHFSIRVAAFLAFRMPRGRSDTLSISSKGASSTNSGEVTLDRAENEPIKDWITSSAHTFGFSFQMSIFLLLSVVFAFQGFSGSVASGSDLGIQQVRDAAKVVAGFIFIPALVAALSEICIWIVGADKYLSEDHNRLLLEEDDIADEKIRDLEAYDSYRVPADDIDCDG
jgi:hypothetical protein